MTNQRQLLDLDEKFTDTLCKCPGKNNEKDEYNSTDVVYHETKNFTETNENSEYLCDAFSCLNIREPTKQWSPPVDCPNFTNTNAQFSSFIPVQCKYSNEFESEIDLVEQPVDYSKKYSESDLTKNSKYSKIKSNEYVVSNFKGFIEKTNKVVKTENYTAYAETDLDQPTDYSLRYAEDDSDSSDICTKLNKNENVEFVQDTVKTYCTEGTPYETPFNFSMSNSMTDLCIDNVSEKDVIFDNNRILEKNKIAQVLFDNTTQKDYHPELKNQHNVKCELSSGMVSPEKPVNYCEEGTPRYFSRVGSFTSLESISGHEVKLEEKTVNNNSFLDSVIEKEKTVSSKCNVSEVKTVKFDQVVNYAEETPLMFSRSSSLASLDSIEQHSIHDDRSSVISDFSRLTSGIVSPSELPDSPTQTVPQSPKSVKRVVEYPSTSDDNCQIVNNETSKSVFEDNVTKFKEENTPAQFSTATSLSSLTIDDQCEMQPCTNIIQETKIEKPKEDYDIDLSPISENDDMLEACIKIGIQKNRHSTKKTQNSEDSCYKECDEIQQIEVPPPLRSDILTHHIAEKTTSLIEKHDIHSDSVRTYYTEDTPAGLSHACSHSDLSVLSLAENDAVIKRDFLSGESSNLSGDEDADDKMLEECIKSAMPKPKKNSNTKADLSTANKNISLLNKIPERNPNCVYDSKKDKLPYVDLALSSSSKNNIHADSIRVYCTEDTPAGLSHAGSHSDLSMLTISENNVKSKDQLLDESNNLSHDDNNILAECIKLGMPKPRKGKETSVIPKDVKETLNMKEIVKNDKLYDSQPNQNQVENSKSTLLINNIGKQQNFTGCSDKNIKCKQRRPYENKIIESTHDRNNVRCIDTSFTEDFSNLSGDDASILEECIKSAMPKHKTTGSKLTNSGLNTLKNNIKTNTTKLPVKKNSCSNDFSKKINECFKPIKKTAQKLLVTGSNTKQCNILPKSKCITNNIDVSSTSNKLILSPNKNHKMKQLSNSGLQKLLENTTNISTVKQNVHSDSVHMYCTEDTPAGLSHAGSQSDLSMLSMLDDTNNKKNDSSDENSSILTGDDDRILNECIKSAMPKPKSIVNNLKNTSFKCDNNNGKITKLVHHNLDNERIITERKKGNTLSSKQATIKNVETGLNLLQTGKNEKESTAHKKLTLSNNAESFDNDQIQHEKSNKTNMAVRKKLTDANYKKISEF